MRKQLIMPKIEDIFKCTRCGYCCQGETTVSLDENDRKRMVRCLGESEEFVSKKYWRITNTVVQMKVRDGHCVFYDEGCTVHQGRPWRCGQWPLHPSILSDRNNFETIRESCPGINKEITYEEFCRILKKIMNKTETVNC